MPEADSGDAKNFHTDVPPPADGFFLKGSGSLDWGMSNRLSRIFRPETGRTVMLAIDHGYFQGPTTGLERVDISILPLVPLADALMCTRGILRSVVPPSMRTPVVMRASGGPSILKELSDEQIAIDEPKKPVPGEALVLALNCKNTFSQPSADARAPDRA